MPELKCQTPDCNNEVADQNHSEMGEWALLHKGELAGLYNSFEKASHEAATRFHCRRCQIRQVSTPPLVLTVSADNLQSANSKLTKLFQKWTRSLTRRLFAANEMAF
ncbi:hypothetical protein H7849_02565 [Alloacidobacterium dinghuense]|uniref:Uncharacterized protein n=1 Tax=Alloacidobacterium dinghuense TaxID=2763107 RepID=A0A7G8BK27_9BACT|nr:hypothetical protein [Alloacidobacterium dinghuense]QNI32897.1 hypothetical protein H7849_02565 [Alloacidobacterium dinghuense]